MNEEKKKIDIFSKETGEIVLLVGLIFIAIGVAFNTFGPMFSKDEPKDEDTTQIKEDNEEEKSNIPTDLSVVSDELNTNISGYLASVFNPTTDNSKNLLSTSRNRMYLVNTIIYNDPTTQTSQYGYKYVKEEEYAKRYEGVFGSTTNMTVDLTTAYTGKASVESELGAGIVGLMMPEVSSIQKTLEVGSIKENENNSYIMTGTYQDKQLGATTNSGDFEIEYINNGKIKYIVSITLTQK